MRLVALPADRQGVVRAALQIETKPGWITYWREPGDAGIPPQITASPTANVSLKKLSLPAPKRLDAGGLQDIGYDQPVTFAVEFSLNEAGAAARIDAGVFIGVCKNICIPFQATFSLAPAATDADLDETADIILKAGKSLPERPSEDFRVTSFRIVPGLEEEPGKLHVELKLPIDTPLQSSFFVTGPENYAFTTVSQQVRNGRNLSVEIPITRLPENYTFEGKTWKILTVAGERAMEADLDFSASNGRKTP